MIRLVKKNEANGAYEVLDACRKAMLASGLDQWYDGYPSIDMVYADIESETLYGFWENDQLVALMTLDEGQSPEYLEVPWTDPVDGQAIAVVHRLAVHPDSQKRGIARKLMDFAEDSSREKGYFSIRLDTYSVNERNVRFYSNRDYQIKGEVRFEMRAYPFICLEKVL